MCLIVFLIYVLKYVVVGPIRKGYRDFIYGPVISNHDRAYSFLLAIVFGWFSPDENLCPNSFDGNELAPP